MNTKCKQCECEFENNRNGTKMFCSDKCTKAFNRAKSDKTDLVRDENVRDDIKSDKPEHCKRCGKELEKEVYGNLIHLVDICHACCKAGGEPIKGKFKVIEKWLHGEDLVYCSEHQGHTLKYCKQVCTEGCHHII